MSKFGAHLHRDQISNFFFALRLGRMGARHRLSESEITSLIRGSGTRGFLITATTSENNSKRRGHLPKWPLRSRAEDIQVRRETALQRGVRISRYLDELPARKAIAREIRW